MSDQLDQSQMSGENQEMGDSQEMEDLSEEQIVATILDLGNQIWANMGQEEPIQDASVFFRDQFYMRFFMSAFPDSDFSQLVETEDEEVMAANIQALIDMLSHKILMYDLEHINGEQIVMGNPEHCINLLQLAKEISCMMNTNSGEIDPDQMQEGNESEQEDNEQPDEMFAMQQQLELEDDEGDQSDSRHQHDSHGVVDYDQIQVELDDEDDNNRQNRHPDSDGDDQENEVSINLEDAIATAEEINKQQRKYVQEEDDSSNNQYEEDEDARAIAGIVTDGHNQKDQFDQMREEQLHKQRMVRRDDEYDEEDSGAYDEEDDMRDGMKQQQEDYSQEDDEDEDGDNNRELQMQIHPDLIAAAHKMGVDLDSEQIQELQKFIEQQNIDLDNDEDSEAEISGDDESQNKKHQDSDDDQAQQLQGSKRKQNQQRSQSLSDKQISKRESSNDQEAYEYLQQEQQYQQEANDEEEEDETGHPEDEEERDEQEDDGEEEEDEKFQFDVDELNEQERQLLVAYLQEEYEKNPDTFQIPKEKLQELINAQLNMRGDNQQYGDEQEDEDGQNEDAEDFDEEQEQQLLMMQAIQNQQIQETQLEDGEGMEEDDQVDEQELEIEGGGQQIEEDDFPTEQEMIDQKLTKEQIQEVLLMKQQQQMQQQYDQDEGDEEADDQHQMHHIYAQQKRKRKPKQNANLAPNTGISKYAQSRGKKAIRNTMTNTAESVEPNPLHRLMRAPIQNSSRATRPQTGKKQKSIQRPHTAKPRQPAQSYKQFIASQSNRTNRQNRNTQGSATQSASTQNLRPVRKQSAKKRNTGSKKSRMNTISHLPQDDQHALKQLMSQQKQEEGQMPMFNEEFLSQLTEEQLQQVIQQQQAVIQQNPQSKSAFSLPPKPRRTRSAKRPRSSGVLKDNQNAKARAQIYSQNVPTINSSHRRTSKNSSTQRKEKVVSKGRGRRKVQPGQGILLNNFFPALESGGRHSTQKRNAIEQYAAQQAAILAAQEAQNQEQIINEVPPEEEEGESQDIVNSRIQQSSIQAQEYAQLQQQMQLVQALEGLDPEQQQEFLEQLSPEQQHQLLMHQQQMQQEGNNYMYAQDENGNQIMLQQEGVEEFDKEDNPDVELTEEQLVELLKNADQLSPEQQAQLQQILKNRWKKEIKSQKEKQYSNIYNILTENVAKAKVRLAKLADSPHKKSSKQQNEDKDTIERIQRQKKEYEGLLRQYSHEQKARNKGKEAEQRKIEKQIAREIKLKQIREKKFEEELINQQKSLMYKRNAQQVRLCQKVYRLASDLEKNKLLEEKKAFLANQNMKKTQKKLMVDGIENFYRDKITMLRERIETEKFERRIAQNAQVEALTRMKRELDLSKKKEIQKYLTLLKQEDQKYDFQSGNLNKLESDIVRLYKK